MGKCCHSCCDDYFWRRTMTTTAKLPTNTNSGEQTDAATSGDGWSQKSWQSLGSFGKCRTLDSDTPTARPQTSRRLNKTCNHRTSFYEITFATKKVERNWWPSTVCRLVWAFPLWTMQEQKIGALFDIISETPMHDQTAHFVCTIGAKR